MKYRLRGPQDLSNAARSGNDGYEASQPARRRRDPRRRRLGNIFKVDGKNCMPEATAAGDADRVAPVWRSGGGCYPYSPLIRCRPLSDIEGHSLLVSSREEAG